MKVGASSAPTYRFGEYRLVAAALRLERAGVAVAMTPRVFSTLLYLVENSGRTVDKDELLRALWPGRIADEANLSQAVSAVRRALGSGQDANGLIVTVPGRGYRFTAAVAIEAASEARPPAEPPPVAVDPAAGTGGPERRHALRVAAAVGLAGVLVCGVILGWRFMAPHATPAGRSRIVLADLQNFTGERAFDHVITRVLQIDLAQSPFVQITPDAKVAETLALMESPKPAVLTPALALAVCARTNGNAAVTPVIAKLGSRYLLTLTASDCSDGKPLFDDRQDVADKEAIPRAVDHLTARMRRRLGEVGASVARFDVPLAPERTRSFEALRAYSEGEWLSRQDRTLEAIPLYRHAVALDPDFAMAYFALSLAYYGVWQPREDAAAIVEAYKRRALVSERDALLIDHHYNMIVTRDLDAALQSLTLMTRLYPNDVTAWSHLSDVQFRMADFTDAIASGARALALDRQRPDSYSVLARPMIRLSELARADEVEAQALRAAPESGPIRQQRIALRFLQGDPAGAETLVASAVGTPLEREALLEGYNLAVASGRMRRASDLMTRATVLGRPNGLQPFFAVEAFNDAALGLSQAGRAALDRVPANRWRGEYDFFAALLDDPKTAEADLARDLARWPDDTLLKAKFAPEARAALYLRRGQPKEAVRALDAVGRFMFMDLDAPYLRASALLAANDAPGATAAFRNILTHTGLGWDAQFWLARLGLARALRLGGNLHDSREEYAKFLAAWRSADPDLPAILQAKAEYADLTRAGARSSR